MWEGACPRRLRHTHENSGNENLHGRVQQKGGTAFFFETNHGWNVRFFEPALGPYGGESTQGVW